MNNSTRVSIILDYLADNEYEAHLAEVGDKQQIVITGGIYNRTAVIPIDYIQAKLFVEGRPPYDKL